MMGRDGRYWSSKEVSMSILSAVGGFTSALRMSNMEGHSDISLYPLYLAQIYANVVTGCPGGTCLWSAVGGRRDMIGIAHTSLASKRSGVSGGGN